MSEYIKLRPELEHPNPEHWIKLKKVKRDERKKLCGGVVMCNGCSAIETAENIFDLHHIHYSNFGNEQAADVNLFCRKCHDAITIRIREEEYERMEKEHYQKIRQKEYEENLAREAADKKRREDYLKSPEYRARVEKERNQIFSETDYWVLAILGLVLLAYFFKYFF